MVSVGVSLLERTDLIFIDPDVKINGSYYRDTLLRQQLLPSICSVSGDFFTFRQDNAPAHHACETVARLSAETPDFIGPQYWPPNSPDLNPVDYAPLYTVWGILQERVYRCRIHDVDHLKERLIAEWLRFDQNIIDRAVNQWLERLHGCVIENGGHFEHQT